MNSYGEGYTYGNSNPFGSDELVTTDHVSIVCADPYGVQQPYGKGAAYGSCYIAPEKVEGPCADTYGVIHPYGNSSPYGSYYVALAGAAPCADPYGLQHPYGNAVAYGECYVETFARGSSGLGFTQLAKADRVSTSSNLTFSQVASYVRAASNELALDYNFDNVLTNGLTLNQSATFIHAASNELALDYNFDAAGTNVLGFSQLANYTHAAKNELTFRQSFVLDAQNTLAFSQDAYPIRGASNTLILTEAGERGARSANNVLSFSASVIEAQNLAGVGDLTFSQEAAHSSIYSPVVEQSLKLRQNIFYTISIGSAVVGAVVGGGSSDGGNEDGSVVNGSSTSNKDVVSTAKVNLNGREFIVSDGYTHGYTYDNTYFLNLSTKYTIDLKRLCTDVDTWPEALALLVGSVVTITNLEVDPFDVFVTSESYLTMEGMTLIGETIEYDTRGVL